MAVSKSQNSTFSLREKGFGPKRDRTFRQISVVSTSLVYCWKSKLELIPAIESLWKHAAKNLRARIIFVDPFSGALASKIQTLLESDLVVMTTVVPDLVVLLRDQLKASTPFAFHTQGEAPGRGGHFASISHLLNSEDLFFANSSAEYRALRLCFPNVRAHILPSPVFRGKPFVPPSAKSGSRAGASRGCYVGRISEQKNLHTVLMGLWSVKDSLLASEFQFHIFGAPDGLGSPYMGIKATPYLENLQRWTRVLGLEKIIRWRGFRPPGEIQRWMKKNRPVFVSMSLHSDEDLGVAALKAIQLGCPAVLSHWGGHIDFKTHFPGQVLTLPVSSTKYGPTISALEMGNGLLQMLSRRSRKRVGGAPSIYLTEIGTQRLLGFLRRGKKARRPLLRSSLVKKSTQRKIWYEKIFDGYADPLARPFFLAYGMSPKKVKSEAAQSVLLPPWGQLNEEVLLVKDPHRGQIRIPLAPVGKRHVAIRALSGMRKGQIDLKQARHLLSQGILLPGACS
ncbi:MAG: glycosyltransferase [Bdellovibrionales bacterium]|nr:glycosyltransferase [Bdellovibrionales bacterium]